MLYGFWTIRIQNRHVKDWQKPNVRQRKYISTAQRNNKNSKNGQMSRPKLTPPVLVLCQYRGKNIYRLHTLNIVYSTMTRTVRARSSTVSMVSPRDTSRRRYTSEPCEATSAAVITGVKYRP